eukprot:7460254-Pyramimonas_sp.AAC.1
MAQPCHGQPRAHEGGHCLLSRRPPSLAGPSPCGPCCLAGEVCHVLSAPPPQPPPSPPTPPPP